MNNTTTHYQTSFRVTDSDGEAFFRLKRAVHGWVLGKESDHNLRGEENAKSFFFRGHWSNLFRTRATVTTDSLLDAQGDAWAIHYTEIDGEVGAKRYWYTDIGLKRAEGVVIVSVRVSFAWNSESLENEPEPPRPSVPRVIRYMLKDNIVFSGRPEFRLIEKPIVFSKVGTGDVLCKFIQSPDRRYPLIVFNGDSRNQICEAEKLARELTGKCQVAVIATNEELAEEVRHFLPEEYWVREDRMRVYFPFSTRFNLPTRHRYYNVHSPEYGEDRQGIIDGLLRRHSLMETGAVETVDDVKRLITRNNLLKLKESVPEHQKELAEFFKLHEEIEKQRDQYKHEAESYAAEVDQREAEVSAERAEVSRLKYDCAAYLNQIAELSQSCVDTANLLPGLPSTLTEVAHAAKRFFPRLIITERAVAAAEKYPECKSVSEAWEMLRHMNNTLFQLKFVDGGKELERSFKDKTGYELGMSEGRNTKRDKDLMDLRRFEYKGKEYDITPHLKHHNNEPKSVRIYFDFDEDSKKIIVGHIGKHIPNNTTKTL